MSLSGIYNVWCKWKSNIAQRYLYFSVNISALYLINDRWTIRKISSRRTLKTSTQKSSTHNLSLRLRSSFLFVSSNARFASNLDNIPFPYFIGIFDNDRWCKKFGVCKYVCTYEQCSRLYQTRRSLVNGQLQNISLILTHEISEMQSWSNIEHELRCYIRK